MGLRAGRERRLARAARFLITMVWYPAAVERRPGSRAYRLPMGVAVPSRTHGTTVLVAEQVRERGELIRFPTERPPRARQPFADLPRVVEVLVHVPAVRRRAELAPVKATVFLRVLDVAVMRSGVLNEPDFAVHVLLQGMRRAGARQRAEVHAVSRSNTA